MEVKVTHSPEHAFVFFDSSATSKETNHEHDCSNSDQNITTCINTNAFVF